MSRKDDIREHCMLRGVRARGGEFYRDLIRDRLEVGRATKDGRRVDFQFPDDPTVSRRQCTLVRDGNSYVIENHSESGTLVDGKVVKESVRLKRGNKIGFGEASTLTFDVLTTEERDAVLTRQADNDDDATSGGPDEVQEGSDTAKTAIVAVLILAFWGGLAAFLLHRRANQEARVEIAVSEHPIEDALALLDGPVASSAPDRLSVAELESEWAPLDAQWKKERPWNTSADFEHLVRSLDLLRRAGHDRSSLALNHDLPVAVATRKLLVELDKEIATRVAHARALLSRGDRRGARKELREIVRRLTPAGNLAVFRFARQKLGELSR